MTRIPAKTTVIGNSGIQNTGMKDITVVYTDRPPRSVDGVFLLTAVRHTRSYGNWMRLRDLKLKEAQVIQIPTNLKS